MTSSLFSGTNIYKKDNQRGASLESVNFPHLSITKYDGGRSAAEGTDN